MKSQKTVFHPVCLSLEDLLGKNYLEAVCRARSFLTGKEETEFQSLIEKKQEFFPDSFQQRLLSLLSRIGQTVCSPLSSTPQGASTTQFRDHTNTSLAPLSGMGYFRLCEDGRLFLISKSEHYHVSLGHSFPGYQLVEQARRLGIPNATHNNTRGHITRILEEELVRAAAGIPSGDFPSLQAVLSSTHPTVLNRVLNLETGSVAAEAAIKLVLSRFYITQDGDPAPPYQGRIPVLVVMGDDDGGLKANYHGTTIIAQLMRGMWPDLMQGMEKQNLFLVRSVRPNDRNELEAIFSQYDQGKYKIAGLFHELVMMNYGARRLQEEFVHRMYALCEQHDVLSVVDEIQTCIWSPELYLFREYRIQPSAVVIGKGFPGGEYAASRILFTSAIDRLPQFGALVTNGQEELASLAYLITMRWVENNADVIRTVGEYFEERLREISTKYPHLIHDIQGKRHMAGIYFHDLDIGKKFVKRMQEFGLDISVQSYKLGCPPVALTKLPLIAGYEAMDVFLDRVDCALGKM